MPILPSRRSAAAAAATPTLVALLVLALGLGACSDATDPVADETLESLAVTVPAYVAEGDTFTVTVEAVGSRGTRPFAYDGAVSLAASTGVLAGATTVGLAGGAAAAEVVLTGAAAPVDITATAAGRTGRGTIAAVALARLPGSDGEPAGPAIPAMPFVVDLGTYDDGGQALDILVVLCAPAATVGQINALLAARQARVVGGVTGNGAFGGILMLKLATRTAAEIAAVEAALAADPAVATVVRDARGAPQLVSRDNGGDPADWTWSLTPVDANWGLEAMRVPQMWNFNAAIAKTGVRSEVGIIDNGFAVPHAQSDLICENVHHNGIQRDHGTHVAGTVAATFNNGTGVDGVNPFARVHAYNAADSSGTFPFAGQLTALAELQAPGSVVRVLNLSIGKEFTFDPTTDAGFRELHARRTDILLALLHDLELQGTLPMIAAAAGNSSNNGFGPIDARWSSTFTSAALDGGEASIIVVEAVDTAGARAGFSCFGGTVSAPGVGIVSTMRSQAYGPMSGTSMASPHVAGLMSYLFAADPTLTNDEMRRIIVDSAFTNYNGLHVVDAFAALLEIDHVRGDDAILRRLVDIDDGTLDGNQRTTPAGDPFLDEDADGDGGAGDGRVDMADFRRWRDWLLHVEDSPDLRLDGPADHPKRDVNGDGVVRAGLGEDLYARGDFNGDGGLDSSLANEVGGNIRAAATDLQVLQRVFDDPVYSVTELPGLLHSGDVTVSPARAFGAAGVVSVTSEVRVAGGLRDERTHATADDLTIYTLPADAATPYELRLVGRNADGAVVGLTEEDVFVALGGDTYWEPELEPTTISVDFTFAGRLHPTEDVALTITARTPDGLPLAAAPIRIWTDNGALGAPTEGVTDAGGAFATTVRLNAYANTATVYAEVTPPSGEPVRASGTGLRRNEIVITERVAHVWALGTFDVLEPPNWRRIYGPADEDEINHFSPYEGSFAVDYSGERDGMQAHSAAQVTHQSDVAFSGNDFAGFVHEASGTATCSLANPGTAEYYANARATSRLEIRFDIWGDPVDFTMNLDASRQCYTTLAAGDVWICFEGNDPCAPDEGDKSFTLTRTATATSVQGQLPAGGGSLISDMHAIVVYGSDETIPDAGSGTEQGHLSLQFSVSH